ncbi:FGGY-family carbohydrate kinase [Alsobacter sp. KACC 23698]|uniref:FGGY-family carbohydrate kinase n=1 Tax=Alsobacter sp. KACC 23698 TaxID=3149229 RepID=A0AAU7JMD9_9HYPH
MDVTLAADLGGTSLRVALMDRDGAAIASAARPQPFGAPGDDEADPERWWVLFQDAAAELRSAAPAAFGRISCVAITGATRTQVLLDAAGRAIRPAMTWAHARAADLAPDLAARLPQDDPEVAHVNAFHPLARLAYVARSWPSDAQAVATVVEPKDVLNARLTGRAASDPISSARLAACLRPSAGGRSLCEIAGLRPPALDLVSPGEAIGRVLPGRGGALDDVAGAPVVMMAHDSWASALGLGALRHGGAYNLSGTTEVLGVFSRRPATSPGLMSVDWGGLTHLGGPGQNGADAAAWAMSVIGAPSGPPGAALDALLAQPRREQPLLFLPYLQGERTPYWDPDLRGAFIGLQRRHGPADLAFAVLEGVAFLNRIVLRQAEEAFGFRAAEIRFGGGGASNAVWAQIKADVCGRAVATSAAPEPGLVGGAIAAAVMGGESLEDAQDRMSRPAARFEPRSDRSAHFDALFHLYREAERAVAPLSHALARMTQPTAFATP